MNPAFTLIESNLLFRIEHIILFISLIGGLIFYAKDFKLGLVIQFIITGGLFMWFYQAGWNFVPSLVIMFMTLVILCLNLYSVSKNTQTGAFI